MRVAFAGTPAFAVPALERLVQGGHEVALVLTQPDRPAGRGQQLRASPVAQAADRLGLRVGKPSTLKTPDALRLLEEARADVMVVAAYGLILPPAVLDLPRRGCLNIHASLLPRWRGAAPVHRAILAGDEVTGVCIMLMDAGLDTGPVLLERRLVIGADDTTGSLTDKLSQLGAEALVEALAGLDSLPARPQDPVGATYATKVEKSESRIDWSRSATEIARQVRAFNPAPGAESTLRGLPLKIWEGSAVDGRALAPGEPLVEGGRLLVGTGKALYEVRTLQRPGGRRMGVEEFLRGNPWDVAQPTDASA